MDREPSEADEVGRAKYPGSSSLKKDKAMADKSYSDSLSTSVEGKSSNAPWIVGGLLVAAGLGYYVYSKSKADAEAAPGAAAAKAGPGPLGGDPLSKPPAEGSTTTGTTPTTQVPGSAVAFNEWPQVNKVALWKILSMFPLTSSDGTYFAVGAAPVQGNAPSGASTIANTDQASPGAMYVLMSPSDNSFLFVDAGTAASQAVGPQAPWQLFLRPGEWRTVSANAAADAANTRIDTSVLPNLPASTLQAYAAAMAGA